MTPRVLAVLGGTAYLGREVVRQAAIAGHLVNVLTRRRPSVEGTSPSVTYVEGDVRDPASVDRAIAPVDAVISTLGHWRDSPADLLTRAMTNVLAAMDRHDVSRIVIVTGLSVPAPEDRPTRGQALRRTLWRAASWRAHRDELRQIAMLVDSDMDWTVARAPRVIDRLPRGRYRVGALSASTGAEIGDSDLAMFVLDCAVNGKHVRAMPVVSY